MKALADSRAQATAAAHSLLKFLETNEPAEMAVQLAAAGNAIQGAILAADGTFKGFARDVSKLAGRAQ